MKVFWCSVPARTDRDSFNDRHSAFLPSDHEPNSIFIALDDPDLARQAR
jgi:hypothetical protein